MTLGDALDDALAVVHEFDGGSIEQKLEALGISASDVRDVLEQRIEAYAPRFEHADEDDSEQVALIQGFVEGLLAMGQLKRDA